jgi:branched-chain amino acid transport system ATP-binding protein
LNRTSGAGAPEGRRVRPDLVLLDVKGVTMDFGGLVALKDVSFAIEEGEIVGLIGANGAGKSTLFNIITGIQRPTSGRVLLNGKDLIGLRPHDIVKLGLSRTFQSVRPFLNYTVEENVRVGMLFGRGEKSEEHLDYLLQLTDLETKRSRLAKTLPIEKRKMVEVARALAAFPGLLLLDEPMGGLNPPEMERFIELIRRVNEEGVTILVVEHVMKAIMNLSRRVIVLHAGLKLAEGTPEEVIANKDVVNVYLGADYARA